MLVLGDGIYFARAHIFRNANYVEESSNYVASVTRNATQKTCNQSMAFKFYYSYNLEQSHA